MAKNGIVRLPLNGYGEIGIREGVRFPMRQYRQLMENIEPAPWKTYEALACHIAEWPFDEVAGPPTEAESYENLDLSEFMAVFTAFSEHMGSRYESKN